MCISNVVISDADKEVEGVGGSHPKNLVVVTLSVSKAPTLQEGEVRL